MICSGGTMSSALHNADLIYELETSFLSQQMSDWNEKANQVDAFNQDELIPLSDVLRCDLISIPKMRTMSAQYIERKAYLIFINQSFKLRIDFVRHYSVIPPYGISVDETLVDFFLTKKPIFEKLFCVTRWEQIGCTLTMTFPKMCQSSWRYKLKGTHALLCSQVESSLNFIMEEEEVKMPNLEETKMPNQVCKKVENLYLIKLGPHLLVPVGDLRSDEKVVEPARQ